MRDTKPKLCPFCEGDSDSIKARSHVECCRCGATAPDLETWNKAPRQSDVDAAYSNGHADGLSECESGAFND